jgi:CubicO group peptidase (beta-lactamase class C family)
MNRLRSAQLLLCCSLLALFIPASAQQASEQSASAQRPTGLGRGRPDTDRYFASSAAATRAIALCSGLWDGNQTMADIDLYSPLHEFYAEQFTTEINEEQRYVAINYDADLPPRYVIWRPVLGCTQLPVGATLDAVAMLPQVAAEFRAPNLDAQPWPMGDRDARGELPDAVQQELNALVASGFDGDTYGGTTWGILVVKDGKIVAEQYALNFDQHKAAQTHSAAKSFASTLIGIATRDYGIDIQSKGIMQAWSREGDPRHDITIEHLLRMSSGLYGEGNGSPQADIYANGATVEGRAATNFLHTLPGERFLYNPPDTMLFLRALREQIGNDADYWEFPFRELFWKIGMTRTTPSSDWNGDFLMSGQTYSTARDFARFGLLYLNRGNWLGEQIFPEEWADYVATPGPAQPAAGAGYGAQFWLYGGMNGLPADAYSPAGGQGNWSVIIPSENLVVVRRGYDGQSRFNITQFSADVVEVLK